MKKFLKITGILVMILGLIYGCILGVTVLEDSRQVGFDEFDIVSAPINFLIITGPFLIGVLLYFFGSKGSKVSYRLPNSKY